MGIKAKNMEIERLAISNVEVFTNKKLTVKTVYWLSRLQKELAKLFKDYADTKAEVLKKYCVKNDDGTPKMNAKGEFQFEGKENTQAVLKEISELANLEVEITGIDKIKLNLDDPGLQGTISADDLLILEPFIEVEIKE